LLKPEADSRSQVVVEGRPLETLAARDYYTRKSLLWGSVTAALDRLRLTYDLVIIEGAGSPAELNLKRNDIVNMAVATYAQSPVALIGDIDRGGVFAQLLGTLWLLPEDERALVKGLIVNKFRGDPKLFVEGLQILEARSDLPMLGVVPYLHQHGIADEDAVVLETAAVRFPRISNFDDLDPLALEPGVRVRYVDVPEALDQPDAIVLPGTKSTIADLEWMNDSGLSAAIRAQANRGVAVVGICGGYQMLGEAIHDPAGLESRRAHMAGMGLLPVVTRFAPHKATHQGTARLVARQGFLGSAPDEPLSGYEIHAGRTESAAPLLEIARADTGETVFDGAVSEGAQIFGTCLHGLFDNDAFRRAWLRSLGWQEQREHSSTNRLRKEAAFDHLADAIEAALDVARLDSIIGL
jgi:adenosylcobyric acid synthase